MKSSTATSFVFYFFFFLFSFFDEARPDRNNGVYIIYMGAAPTKTSGSSAVELLELMKWCVKRRHSTIAKPYSKTIFVNNMLI